MGSHFDHITPEQADLIRQSKVYFIASVTPDLSTGADDVGPVNLSPKGGTPLHVLDTHRVAYLDYPGSGNETARHIQAGGPVTIMVMAMDDKNAAIVRLYGTGRVIPADEYPASSPVIEQGAKYLNRPRQVIEVHVTQTQTSCGYGVPIFDYVGERSRSNRGRRYKG